MKRALITGITGQDGSYLAEFLISKGYEVHGVIRRASTFNTVRIDHIPSYEVHVPDARLFTYYGDMVDSSNLNRILEKVQPDEIYNLAAQSHVKVSFEVPEYSAEVDAMGVLRLLDAIRELGLTYKPNTDVVEESASMKIAQALLQDGAQLSVYDPAAMNNARKVLGEGVKYARSVEECLKGTEFCILATPWDEFKNLKYEDFRKCMKKPVLLDCWRIFDRAEFSQKLGYFAIGLAL